MDKLHRRYLLAGLCLAAAASVAPGPQALAADTIKIGVLDQFSGQFADFGQQIGNGVETYIREHGDTVAGKKIVVIRRDQGGPSPERAKQLAQELIVRDKVDFIAGIDFSPTAFAIAPLITEAKLPTVIMNAATLSITDTSPYFVRFASTLEALETKFGEWAAGNGIKKCYIVVSDYVAGHAAGDSFKKAFTANRRRDRRRDGRAAAGTRFRRLCAAHRRRQARSDLPVPGRAPSNPRNSPSSMPRPGSRPPGRSCSAPRIFSRNRPRPRARPAMPKSAPIRCRTIRGRSTTRVNKKYVAAYTKYFGTEIHPDFMSVSGYDGMAGIYRVIQRASRQDRRRQGDGGLQGPGISPARADPISIDPATRDVDSADLYPPGRAPRTASSSTRRSTRSTTCTITSTNERRRHQRRERSMVLATTGQ